EEYERQRLETQRKIEEERQKVFAVQYQEAEEEIKRQEEETRLAREDEERRRLIEEERIRLEREEQERLEQERIGMFTKLMNGLSKTRDNILSGVEDVLSRFKKIDEELYEELEEVLIMADFGVETSGRILDELKEIVKERKIVDPEDLKGALQEIITGILTSQEVTPIIVDDKPNVVLVIGVNGVGKTTTIGKLSHQLNSKGKKVIVAAADTFRAAAIEQLQIWAQRAQVDLIKHDEGSDPASVVFDAIAAAKARKADVLICDTAGRLQNKVNLMKELEKISRIIEREYPEAHKEVLIVLDATTGQNALSQVKIFKEVAKVDGIILTKLDGTAKGGAIVGICSSLNVPVKYIGVGETIEDLQVFDAQAFAKALFLQHVPKQVDSEEVTVDEEVVDEVVGDGVVDKDVVDEEVVDEDVVDKEVVDEEVVDEEVVDKEVVDKEVVDKEAVDKEVVDKEVVDKEVVDEKEASGEEEVKPQEPVTRAPAKKGNKKSRKSSKK
ncbi:MAG: signal recognition particle-docking protein FtsY, partial [Epulopiscium sp. Nele67-Bin001]